MSNPAESGESATVVRSRIRILLVDDYVPWRRFVASLIHHSSELELVGEVADGIEAIRTGLELKPDLLLLDIGLPRRNGIEVARCISKMLPPTKIIFLTENSDRDVMAQCLGDGGLGYVVKVDARSELLPAIAAVMQGTRYISKRLKGSAARSGET